MRNYIEEYVFDFETALLNDDLTSSTRTYTDYIDLASFADGFIMNELAGNIDAYRISTFLHKPRGEKLRFGPIWDLNIGYGRQGECLGRTGLRTTTTMSTKMLGWCRFGGIACLMIHNSEPW